jgi:hypothetical protein
VSSRQDLTVNPQRPVRFSQDTHTPHLEVDGVMGHFAVIDEERLPAILGAIQRFLGGDIHPD